MGRRAWAPPLAPVLTLVLALVLALPLALPLARVLALVLGLLLGAGVALTPVGLWSPASAAPDSAYRDTQADRTRIIPAYLASADPDRVVQVFSVRFWARAGERRYVTSQVVARQPSSTSDSALMASVSVTCSPDGGGVVNAGATENLVRGAASVFTPRFVYAAPRTGMVSCVLVASGLRPRPVASGRRSSNTWSVGAGSYLSVSEPTASWARSLQAASRSRVLDAAERWTPIATVAPVRGADAFEVTSDHKVTTCSSVGGSRDPSTLGRDLCSGRVSPRGSVVRLVVSAVQLGRGDAPCARPQVFSTLRRVSPAVHHAMIFSTSVVRVSDAPACRPRFAIRGSLEHVRGADVVVHAPSERTAIVRH